jgi:hypothetical protein
LHVYFSIDRFVTEQYFLNSLQDNVLAHGHTLCKMNKVNLNLIRWSDGIKIRKQVIDKSTYVPFFMEGQNVHAHM